MKARGVVVRGDVVRVRGFAMRYDDWVVTRCCDLYGGDL